VTAGFHTGLLLIAMSFGWSLHLSTEVGDSHAAVVNKSEENDFEKKDSSNPVVYQLVRVNS